MQRDKDEITVNKWLLLLALFTTLLIGFEFGRRLYIEEQLKEPQQAARIGRNGGPSIPPMEPEAPPLYRVIWELMSEEKNEE
ncbi:MULTISPECIES: hypothetical protein [Pseudoalteromonas]|uniref:hypothetical protein n=1 Tax=Pseudoalteromonas TaxID=53246 RepID=UPI00110A7D79|nr:MULTISPECIES: hypothetical protein [Pseudoalteromonas]MCG9768661.1 hypothetical protein [Pseudoalteromonas piscicida]TMN39060.1 hypothetical protein CWC03_10225 [Pseudoalteromonas sp. S2755]